MQSNSIEAILEKTKQRGIKVNERYEGLISKKAETAIAETAIAKTAIAKTAIAKTAIAETAIAKTAIAKTAIAETAIAKNGGYEESVNVFKLFLDMILNLSTYEQRMLDTVITKNKTREFMDISNDEFIKNGVHQRYVKETIGLLTEKNIIDSKKDKIDGRLKNVFRLSLYFLKQIDLKNLKMGRLIN